MCNIETNIIFSILKGLLRKNKQIYKKRRLNNLKLHYIRVAILRETFYKILPEVNHFSKERKGNQPRLRK